MDTREDLVQEIKGVLYRLLSDSKAYNFGDDHILDGYVLDYLRDWAVTKGADMLDAKRSTIEKFAEQVLQKIKMQETEISPQKRK